MNTFIVVFCLLGKQNKPPEVGITLFYKLRQYFSLWFKEY